ncbi:hypothetical protein GCM10022409_25180 [Hymenobacter glaciei]|uniref:Uncharacterized protein n=1 Tax=Hymenobacter glaciei TaxID=877209 RepID=A0ABP7U9Q3_9BACT
MSSTTEVSASHKSAYQRPYKTRSQRRELARRKHDENSDQKFLIRVAVVVGLVLLVALGIAMKGSSDTTTPPSMTEAMH